MDSDAVRRLGGNNAVDHTEVNEDAFRQALERMGSQHRRNASPGSARPAQENRRRRFVQDGEVLVEHHAASRGPAQRQPATSTPEDLAEIERLRLALKREQRRIEDGQRLLQDNQIQLRSLETRAAHAEIRVKEMQEIVRERDQKIADLMAQFREQAAALDAAKSMARNGAVSAARAPAISRVASTQPRPRGRPPKIVATPVEPEPVKWWVED